MNALAEIIFLQIIMAVRAVLEQGWGKCISGATRSTQKLWLIIPHRI